jgi:hypothetical protein
MADEVARFVGSAAPVGYLLRARLHPAETWAGDVPDEQEPAAKARKPDRHAAQASTDHAAVAAVIRGAFRPDHIKE